MSIIMELSTWVLKPNKQLRSETKEDLWKVTILIRHFDFDNDLLSARKHSIPKLEINREFEFSNHL